MADHYIDCTLADAQRVAEELATGKVLLRMEEQPPEGVGPDTVLYFVTCPYAPGDALRFREPWEVCGEQFSSFTTQREWPPLYDRWQHPSTMPDAAIRLEITVGSCEPVEIDGVWWWEVLSTIQALANKQDVGPLRSVDDLVIEGLPPDEEPKPPSWRHKRR